MYAIVEIAGQQFKIEKDHKIFVHRLKAEEGSQITFDRVMLVDNDGSIKVGSPTVTGASVSATVLNHLKGEKVLIFKKKRRKGYQKMNGHRQYLTAIKIDDITI
ncbi:MAG TPA: 50S ribosomal protein L21 [Bacteroidales bacterium]|jgi:large subunit ribosomal protein L21|nr:50S ribosomal protein L21 [Bacteroidales bacterium]HPE40032.1 50S ribosomal protein L21 [Bacteroidales bacterium]